MGNGKSRMVSAQCSCMSIKNEGDQKAVFKKPNNKRCASNNSDGVDFNSKLVEMCMKEKTKSKANKPSEHSYPTIGKEKPKTRASNGKSCECKYSLQPLTPSEQLEEVEAVFKEKARKRAGETSGGRRRASEASKGKTCCDCLKAKRRMGNRNILQKPNEPKKKCQCCVCKGQGSQLSEAQAIADAIQKYCARERKRAIERITKERKGEKTQRCCMCNEKIEGKRVEPEPATDEETDEDWDVEVDMECDCCCSQFEEYTQGDQKCCKCAATTKASDEAEVYINADEIANVNENMANKGLDEDTCESFEDQQQAQQHAKGCTCCDCKKQQQSVPRASMNEAHISVDDIEFEAFPEKQANRTPRRSRTSFQAPTPRASKSVRAQQRVSEVQETEMEVLHEREVFMKKINLSEESGDEESAYTLAAKERRTRMSQNGKSDDGPHVRGCRCCQCKKAPDSRRSPSVVYIEKVQSPSRRSTASINQERKSVPRESYAENRSQRRSTSSFPHGSYPENRSQRRSTSSRRNERPEQEYQVKRESKRSSNIGTENTQCRDRAPDRTRASQQSRRYSTNLEDEGGVSIEIHSKRCTCCECKKQKESEKNYYKCVYDEEEKMAERYVEPEYEKEREKKNCCCNTRKRTSRGSYDDYRETKAKRYEKQTGSNACCTCRKHKDSTKDARRCSEQLRASMCSQSRERQAHRVEKQCRTTCTCKKRKRVPLTKSCCCTRGKDEVLSPARRQREEDEERKRLAEELANRIQRRAALQTELQKRLQEQQKLKRKQRCCCCYSEPSPPLQSCCCYMPTTCCQQSYGTPPPQPCSFENQPCCCPTSPAPTIYCEPPTCCCEPQTGYGRECPCCCQTMPFCYAATCRMSA